MWACFCFCFFVLYCLLLTKFLLRSRAELLVSLEANAEGVAAAEHAAARLRAAAASHALCEAGRWRNVAAAVGELASAFVQEKASLESQLQEARLAAASSRAAAAALVEARVVGGEAPGSVDALRAALGDPVSFSAQCDAIRCLRRSGGSEEDEEAVSIINAGLSAHRDDERVLEAALEGLDGLLPSAVAAAGGAIAVTVALVRHCDFMPLRAPSFRVLSALSGFEAGAAALLRAGTASSLVSLLCIRLGDEDLTRRAVDLLGLMCSAGQPLQADALGAGFPAAAVAALRAHEGSIHTAAKAAAALATVAHTSGGEAAAVAAGAHAALCSAMRAHGSAAGTGRAPQLCVRYMRLRGKALHFPGRPASCVPRRTVEAC